MSLCHWDWGVGSVSILNVSKTKIILNLENDEAQRVQYFLFIPDVENHVDHPF